MLVLHSARRVPVVASLLLLLAACSHDNGPSEFNPAGATADLTAAEDAFQAPAVTSYGAVSSDIAFALGGSAAVVGSPALALSGSSSRERYARAVTRMLPASSGMQASVAAIPASALGTTYEWDTTSDVYVQSDLPGAPSNGVRFLLYAVNPVTLRPVEPLDEVGYVDFIDESGSSTLAVRAIVVSNGTTYLDYSVHASGTSSSGSVTVTGYASDGTIRANFNLENALTQTTDGITLELDYGLDVPNRNLELDWTATISEVSGQETQVGVDLTIQGENGTIRLQGTVAAGDGSFTVRVNGDLFATITLSSGSEAVITGANGGTLTAEEEETLRTILSYYDDSFGVFGALLAPIG
ncbi:MAG TPA: hypothetical protein VHR41_08295 [Gemmatimonadales bacterium]|jgi:hypothetical protein|nr:hypothetical protein [Gemmatimonadales bacterium]